MHRLCLIENVYLVEYAAIQKEFFISRHGGDVSRANNGLSSCYCNIVLQQLPRVMGIALFLGKTQQTGMDGPIRYSALTL
jgi:hypothetical protein